MSVGGGNSIAGESSVRQVNRQARDQPYSFPEKWGAGWRQIICGVFDTVSLVKGGTEFEQVKVSETDSLVSLVCRPPLPGKGDLEPSGTLKQMVSAQPRRWWCCLTH